MKISTITILLLLGMLAIVASLWVVGSPGEGGFAAGTAHPTIEHMAIGGPGEAKHEKVFGLGIAFGILEIILFSVCLALGASRMEKVGRMGVWIAIGAVLHVITFLAIVVSYRSYLNGSETLYWVCPRPRHS